MHSVGGSGTVVPLLTSAAYAYSTAGADSLHFDRKEGFQQREMLLLALGSGFG